MWHSLRCKRKALKIGTEGGPRGPVVYRATNTLLCNYMKLDVAPFTCGKGACGGLFV